MYVGIDQEGSRCEWIKYVMKLVSCVGSLWPLWVLVIVMRKLYCRKRWMVGFSNVSYGIIKRS